VSGLTKAVDDTLTPTDDKPSPNKATITLYNGNGYKVIPPPKAVSAACVPLFTGSVGESTWPPDAGSDYPNLDIVEGNMHNTKTTLTGVLTVDDLETGVTAVPPGGTAIEYTLSWAYGTTDWFLNAEVAATGNTFTYGETTVGTGGQSSSTTLGDATGTIVTGQNGTITMTIPLSDVGSPANGDALTGPNGRTEILEGAPSNPATSGGEEFYATPPVGPQYNYTLGEICRATGKPGSDG
jgi:hypothetical protein